jgi:Tol biopolymer transport system component
VGTEWSIEVVMGRSDMKPYTFRMCMATAGVATALAACGGSPSNARSGGAATTPSPVVTAHAGTSASGSPVGNSHAAGHIAYGRFDPAGVSLFTANADGTGVKALAPGTGGEQPHFTPDGSKIALTATSGSRIVGAVINADGTGYRAFTPATGSPNLACVFWSPDAKRLACEGFDDNNPALNGIYTVRATDGLDLRRLSNHRDIPCAYSPDGKSLVYLRYNPTDETNNDLMVMTADGGNPNLIRKGVGLSCDWSPDGQHLLTEAHGKLLLLDLHGSGSAIPLPLTSAGRGSFSPDGTRIIFSGISDTKEDIYTAKVDGSDLVQITNTPARDEEFGDWGL